ncbi:DUF1707 and DUF4190 domain-containing protein [Streptomyces aidingensis]|uniref:Uncharacterized protein n=1 Tax=Streptomyces aidingensis TaxID=910347 RepID=A0A1I1HJA0_9ACTN|nr:DUF1707 and DUF4190 domain-containing protein [Streptomyces aidingensis]SFC24054.1 protein of unknown function [Streptomyces aidingensis]
MAAHYPGGHYPPAGPPGSPPPRPEWQQAALRVADADRERTADVLRAGFAEGRLTRQELDDRLERLPRCLTYADLALLVGDLPQGPGPRPEWPPAGPYPAPRPDPAPLVHIRPPAVPGAGLKPPKPPINGSALIAGICAGLIPSTLGLTAVPAVIYGHKGHAEIRRTGESGSGFATAGVVSGYVTLAVLLTLILAIVAAV